MPARRHRTTTRRSWLFACYPGREEPRSGAPEEPETVCETGLSEAAVGSAGCRAVRRGKRLAAGVGTALWSRPVPGGWVSGAASTSGSRPRSPVQFFHHNLQEDAVLTICCRPLPAGGILLRLLEQPQAVVLATGAGEDPRDLAALRAATYTSCTRRRGMGPTRSGAAGQTVPGGNFKCTCRPLGSVQQ